MRAEIHHRSAHIVSVGGMSAIGDQFIIIDLVKGEMEVALKCEILVANTIDPADQFFQAIGLIQIPCANFILF